MAVVTHGPHDYRYEEVPRPRAGFGEMLVKVEACGICAGDIKAYNGGEVFWGSNGKPPYLEAPAIGTSLLEELLKSARVLTASLTSRPATAVSRSATGSQPNR